jgi:hypothetical protein
MRFVAVDKVTEFPAEETTVQCDALLWNMK